MSRRRGTSGKIRVRDVAVGEIPPGGTKYVSSVQHGGISRIRPGGAAELIARNIPSATSMCYDPKAHQLVVPMNPNNGLAFVELE